MEFFYSPGSCSLASHIVLAESGAPYTAYALDFRRQDQMSERYRAINPRGKVPALRVDGSVLTENLAIMWYIAMNWPEAGLLPTASMEQARCLSLISWLGTQVHAAFTRLHRASRFLDDSAGQDSLRAKARDAFCDGMGELDALVAGREWLVGDRFSIADAYAYVFWTWAGTADDKRQRWHAYRALAERIELRPAVISTLETERNAIPHLRERFRR